ncbi:TlpA family protein disulfide reductase [Sphingobacterium detergens]
MKSKNIIITVLVALFFFSFNPLFSQINLKIKGKVTGDTKGFDKIYIFKGQFQDSTAISPNGEYQITITSEAPDVMYFYLQYESKVKGYVSPFSLFIEKSGTLQLDFDIEKGISSGQINGPTRSVAYFDYSRAKKSIHERINKEITSKFGEEALKEGTTNFDKAMDYFEKRETQLNDSLFAKYFNPNGADAPFMLLGRVSSLSLAQLEHNYSKLSAPLKETKAAKQLYEKIASKKRSSIGSTVANFVLPDTTGNDFSFNKLKGKYVLIDFWASWCGPCRISFPRLRSVYQQLKGQNFEIINISIDAKLDDWKKAVKEENNPWPQLHDKTNLSKSAFFVSGIPTAYLIDPDGKIVFSSVGSDENGGGPMEEKLESIFGIKLTK